MKKLIFIICLALSSNSFAEDRFSSGPRMVSDGLEYISFMATRHVVYNLYIHPKLLKKLNDFEGTANRNAGEVELKKVSTDICKKNKSDSCTVYFWDNLNIIPVANKKHSNADFKRAAGSFAGDASGRGAFKWNRGKSDSNGFDQGDEIPSLDDIQ